MTLKKKLIMLCVLVLTLMLCCFGLVACGDGGDNGGALGGGGQQTEGTPSGGEADGEGEVGSTGDEEPEENIDWTLVYTVNDDGSTITGLTEYGKTLSKIVIPETLNGKTITSIGSSAFEYCNSLTSITIPNSVTSIGINAFSGCYSLIYGLNKVNYTGTVDQWAQISFGNKYSNPIYYAKKLYINDVLLTEASITTATKINSYAFYECTSLTSVTIGSGVTSIGKDAFDECYKIVEVINKSELNITKGSSDNGSVGEYALKVKTSGESEVVNQNGYLFYICDETNYFVGAGEGTNYLLGYKGEETDLNLPDKYNEEDYDVYQYAFKYCTSLTSVIIPDGVTSIGEGAFSDCVSLTSVTIGSGVTGIRNYAFSGCYKLVEVINKSELNITKGSSYDGCVGYYALKVKTSGESEIVNQNNYLFYTYEGTNYLLDYKGKATSLTLPDKYNGENYEIYEFAFLYCSSLKSITISNGVTSIGGWAFSNCALLTDVTIGSGVTSIGNDVFYNCKSLTSIVIPDSVTSIGSSAFSGCTSLTSVTIGNSVTSIGSSAFYGCDNLQYNEYENAYYLGNESNPYLWLIKAKSKDITTCTINDNCKFIHSSAFGYCSSLTNIVLPDGVTNIGNSAFGYCSSLTSIVIPDSVTSIGSSAFSGCDNLQYNEYENAYYLGNEGNPYLWLIKAKSMDITTCTINDNCKFICSGAFLWCFSLTSITIPDSVISIEYNAFEYCDSLTSVTFKNTEGWFVSYSSTATSGTDVTVTDAAQNATYLKSTYRNYYWKRK